MARPKHRRCTACRAVTSRYSHTVTQGPLTRRVWVVDPAAGEVLRRNGLDVYCTAHAPEGPR